MSSVECAFQGDKNILKQENSDISYKNYNQCFVAGSYIQHLVSILLLFMSVITIILIPTAKCMTEEEIVELREESKDMFYHAYNAYLFNAFPADELMPLSCQGKTSWRIS